jgi:hypothetical protein
MAIRTSSQTKVRTKQKLKPEYHRMPLFSAVFPDKVFDRPGNLCLKLFPGRKPLCPIHQEFPAYYYGIYKKNTSLL